MLSEPAQQPASYLQTARQHAGLTLRELARRAGTSHATLIAYESGRKSPTLRTFLRIVEACDLAVDVTFRPRIRSRRGMPRGEELEQVLRLAEAFPAGAGQPLRAPNFGHLMRGPQA